MSSSNHPPFETPATLLRRYGFSAKKSWGQNFLCSERAYRAIVDATIDDPTDWVIEIGAGLGTLTVRLFQRIPEGKLIAVERDQDMLTVLEGELGHFEDLEIMPANALDFDYGGIARWCGEKISVCGNLPYNISSQIIFRLLSFHQSIKRIVVMLQKEMADRIIANPGSKTYGALSVMMQAYGDIRRVINVPNTAFLPPPKVDSAVIRIDLRQENMRMGKANPKSFSKVVHAAFAQRRKTIRNSLQTAFEKQTVLLALEKSMIDGGRRAETLSVEEFSKLTLAFSDHA